MSESVFQLEGCRLEGCCGLSGEPEIGMSLKGNTNVQITVSTPLGNYLGWSALVDNAKEISMISHKTGSDRFHRFRCSLAWRAKAVVGRVHVEVPGLILSGADLHVILLSFDPFKLKRVVLLWHGDAMLECVIVRQFPIILLNFGVVLELDMIISTIANTNDVGHFELIFYSSPSFS